MSQNLIIRADLSKKRMCMPVSCFESLEHGGFCIIIFINTESKARN